MFMQKFKKRGSARLTAMLLAAGLVFSNAGTVNVRGEGYDIVNAGIVEADTAITREKGTGRQDEAAGELLSEEEGWEEASEGVEDAGGLLEDPDADAMDASDGNESESEMDSASETDAENETDLDLDGADDVDEMDEADEALIAGNEQNPQPSEVGLDETLIESSDLDESLKEEEEFGMETSDLETDGMETEQEAGGEGGFATGSEGSDAEESNDSGEEMQDDGDDDPAEWTGASDDVVSGDGRDVLGDADSDAESRYADDSEWESEELNEGDELESSYEDEGDEVESSDENEESEAGSSDEDEWDEIESSTENGWNEIESSTENGWDEMESSGENEGDELESSVENEGSSGESELPDTVSDDGTEGSETAYDSDGELTESEGIGEGTQGTEELYEGESFISEEETDLSGVDYGVLEEEAFILGNSGGYADAAGQGLLEGSGDAAALFEEAEGESADVEDVEGVEKGDLTGITGSGEEILETEAGSEKVHEKDQENGSDKNSDLEHAREKESVGDSGNRAGNAPEEAKPETGKTREREERLKEKKDATGSSGKADSEEALKDKSGNDALPLHVDTEYNILFDANGGEFSDGSASREEVSDGSWTWSSSILSDVSEDVSNGDYVLAGWTTNQDGSGRLYTRNAYFYPNSDVTLYAKWEYPIMVKFNGNGGKLGASVKNIPCFYDEVITLMTGSDGASRKNYALEGWTEDKKGEGPVWKERYLVKKDVTLYAKWKKIEKEYTIRFNANGGIINDSEYKTGKKLKKGEIISLSTYKNYDPAASKSGKVLLGWTEKKNKGEVLTEYKVSGNATLYAYWGAAYKVTLDGNGGTSGGSGKIVKYVAKGDSCSFDSFYRSDYKLLGFTTDKGGKGALITEPYIPEKNIKLYAKWTNKKVTIKLNAGKGYIQDSYSYTGSKSHVKEVEAWKGASFGSSYVFSYSNDPTLKNRGFKCWCYDKALKKPVKKTDVISKSATLYAKWDDEPIKVTVKNLLLNCSYQMEMGHLDVRGSEKTSDSFYISKGSTIGIVSASIYDIETGYRSASFYFDKKHTKPYSSSFVPEKNVTLFADWETGEDEYDKSWLKISWDANGGYRIGNHGEKDTGGVYDTFIGRSIGWSLGEEKDMRRAGYYFAGWYDEADAYKRILPKSHVFTRETRLKAEWKKGIRITLKLVGGRMNARDESAFMPNFTIKKGSSIFETVGDMPVPTRSGYVFQGWKSSLSGKIVSDFSTERPAKACSYTAVWKKESKKTAYITVTLKGEGGIIYNYNRDRCVSTMKLRVPKGITYEELYSDYLYDEEYDGVSYGKESAERLHVEHGSDKSLYAEGWSTKKSGNELSRGYSFTKNTTLYPVFKKHGYNVVMVMNGGNYWGWNSPLPYLYHWFGSNGIILEFPEQTFGEGNTYVERIISRGKRTRLPDEDLMSREGYSFGGWYTDAALKKKLKNPDKFKPTANTYLYAKWIEVPVEEIVLNKGEAEIKVRQNFDLKNNLDVSPLSASRELLSYQSSNPEVAEVTSDGLVKGLQAGSTVITVSSNSRKSVEFYVTVE